MPTRFAPISLAQVETVPAEQLGQIEFSVTERGCKLVMPLGEKTEIYGFGMQSKSFNHRGNKITSRVNADPKADSGDSHAPVPFFITDEGWGMYVDTARNAVFYCGNELNKRLVSNSFKAEGQSEFIDNTDELYAAKRQNTSAMTVEIPYAQGVDVYYFTGERILDIVMAYNMLSGGGCMPERWGMANFYRCCGSFGENEVLDIAKQFRELKIPCDMFGLEPGWQSRSYSCSYVWSDKFPHHKEMMKTLCDMGFKVNLWEHAFTHPSSPIFDKLIPYSGDYYVWNGLVPDFSIKECSDIFAAHQKTFADEGVKGFKLDECDGSDFTGGWSFPDCSSFPSGMDGEVYHHLFGTLYVQSIIKALGNRRTFSQVRSMGALCSSYPFVLYSDLCDYDDFLTGLVNSGFSGLLWSPEVPTWEMNKDELIRRLQLVTFSVQSLVNAWTYPEMPWLKSGATDEVRRIWEVRMQLIPYLYTVFYDYKTTGKPPVRALICDYPEARGITNQFILGDMIVAPIYPGKTGRELWLPEGEWHPFFGGEVLTGGKHYVETPDIPVYIRSGTILPLAKPVQHVEDDTVFDITLKYYGDCTSSECRLVEDEDGGYKVLRVRKGEVLCSEHYNVN